MIEVGVIVDLDGKAFYWHLPEGRSSVTLPDSPAFWSIIWKYRAKIAGIAHSHPGRGIPEPSYEDLTTFIAVEQALGRKLKWWITTSDDAVLIKVFASNEYSKFPLKDTPGWLVELRRLSAAGVDEAPKGTIWICHACGKQARNRSTGGISKNWGEPCMLDALLCDESSLIFKDDGETVIDARPYGAEKGGTHA